MKAKQKRAVLVSAAVSLLIAVMAITAVASAGSAGKAAAKKPIYVLALTDTSGSHSYFGIQYRNGMLAAAAYYNAKGGILGRPVQVVVKNDNADPATAVSIAVKELSSNPGKYSMVFAGEEATITTALIPIMNRYKQYSVELNDGGQGLCANASKCPYFFSLSGPSGAYALGDAQYLAKFKNVGILSGQNPFTDGETDLVKKYLESKGVKVNVKTFPSTVTSVTPELQSLISDGAEAIFNAALLPTSFLVFSAREALGSKVPIVFDIGSSSSGDLSKVAPSPSALVNTFQTSWYCQDPRNNAKVPALAQALKYVQKTKVRFGATDACWGVGTGWNAIALLANAANKAQSVTSANLTAATEKLNLTAKQGMFLGVQRYCWSKKNHLNFCNVPSDFPVIPSGTIKNLQIVSK